MVEIIQHMGYAKKRRPIIIGANKNMSVNSNPHPWSMATKLPKTLSMLKKTKRAGVQNGCLVHLQWFKQLHCSWTLLVNYSNLTNPIWPCKISWWHGGFSQFWHFFRMEKNHHPTHYPSPKTRGPQTSKSSLVAIATNSKMPQEPRLALGFNHQLPGIFR